MWNLMSHFALHSYIKMINIDHGLAWEWILLLRPSWDCTLRFPTVPTGLVSTAPAVHIIMVHLLVSATICWSHDATMTVIIMQYWTVFFCMSMVQRKMLCIWKKSWTYNQKTFGCLTHDYVSLANCFHSLCINTFPWPYLGK